MVVGNWCFGFCHFKRFKLANPIHSFWKRVCTSCRPYIATPFTKCNVFIWGDGNRDSAVEKKGSLYVDFMHNTGFSSDIIRTRCCLSSVIRFNLKCDFEWLKSGWRPHWLYINIVSGTYTYCVELGVTALLVDGFCVSQQWIICNVLFLNRIGKEVNSSINIPSPNNTCGKLRC